MSCSEGSIEFYLDAVYLDDSVIVLEMVEKPYIPLWKNILIKYPFFHKLFEKSITTKRTIVRYSFREIAKRKNNHSLKERNNCANYRYLDLQREFKAIQNCEKGFKKILGRKVPTLQSNIHDISQINQRILFGVPCWIPNCTKESIGYKPEYLSSPKEKTTYKKKKKSHISHCKNCERRARNQYFIDSLRTLQCPICFRKFS